MTQSLKIECLVTDLTLEGEVASFLVTKEQLTAGLSKKADLVDGKIKESNLPDFIANSFQTINQKLVTLEESISDGIQSAKDYSEAYANEKLIDKADLVDGKVPQTQLPSVEQYEGLSETLNGVLDQARRDMIERTDEIQRTKVDLGEDGKVVRAQLPNYDKIPGLETVVTDLYDSKANVDDVETSFKESQEQLDAHSLLLQSLGSILPYNPSNTYAEGYVTLKDGILQQLVSEKWAPFKINTLNAVDASGESQQQVNYNGGSKWHYRDGGYQENERAVLDNGDIVKSTVDGNVNDPNANMTGWYLFDEKSVIATVECIADLQNLNGWNGRVVFVKSYYKGLNSGGDDFIFSTETNLTSKVGFIINVEGGCWKRVLKTSYSIEDAGAHPTQSREVNTLAINTALEMSKDVFVPTATYLISPTGINLNTGNYLHGKGVFVGDAPDTIAADGTGTYLIGGGVNNVKIEGITLKNGYRGTGIIFYDAKDITIRDVTVDGFTYGITLREKNFQEADTNGVQDAILENIVIKNTRYWGIYLRCYGTTTQAKKTQRIKVLNPYFYNCHMAGYVEAEGNVRHTVLENPVFERCNVCMHYELSSDFTVTNPRTIDTGKKSDHLPANTEYPFENWSLYLCFVERGQVNGGNLDAEVNLLGTSNGKVVDISFLNVNAITYSFEGIDGATSQDNYRNISWVGGSVTGAIIYQKAGTSYLRDINIDGVFSKMNGDNNGNAVSINARRCVNMTVKNCTFTNSALKVAVKGICHILDNKWIVGTDNTNNSFDGTNGNLSGNFLDFSGNTFTRAGGVVYGATANFITNWTRVRTDNVIRGNNISYAYEFKDNYRVEMGGSLVYDTNVGSYVDTGTTSFVHLFRA